MIDAIKGRRELISELNDMHNEYFIVCLDIVRFRSVNDIYGIKAGDLILKEVISNSIDLNIDAKIKPFIYEKDTIFLIVEKSNDDGVMRIINKIARSKYSYDIKFRAAYRKIKDSNTALEFTENINKVIKRREYIVEGDNCCFDASNDIEEYIAIKRDLMSDKESFFSLVYQPKVDIKTNKINSCEVLCRWIHPKFGVVAPCRFLPIISDLYKEVDFDLFIFKKACSEIKSIIKYINRFSVNISINTIKEKNIHEKIYKIVKENKIEPNNITIEILEDRSNGDYSSIISNILYLRDLGFKISIDDFGTGYSSYYRLSRLKCTEVKIPREFLLEENTGKHEVMLKSLIGMCKDLGCEIVIEGVETENQKKFAEIIGADYIQGHFYSKPLNKEMFESFAKRYFYGCKNREVYEDNN